MRAFLLCVLVAGIVGAGYLACNPNSIGRPCVNPLGSDVRGTQVSSPALECPSRLCLITPPTGMATAARATCTASCESDGDCDPENRDQCSHFVCAVAATAGPFCCRKVCICRDDLRAGENQDPVDGGAMLPVSCDPRTYQQAGTTPQCPNIKLK